MDITIPEKLSIATTLNLPSHQVDKTLSLLLEGATVPFIARYRKEATGSLDEVAIGQIRDEFLNLEKVNKRRNAILESLEKNNLLTEELATALAGAKDLTGLEDIYLPFRPKRKTRALQAKEKGLQPLADILLSGRGNKKDINRFINQENNLATEEECLAGACDIIAEQISENLTSREVLRELFFNHSLITAKAKKNATELEEGGKFRDYFDWQETITKVPGHRILAMFRGENKKILSLTIRPPEEKAISLLFSRHVDDSSPWRQQLDEAARDSYKRLLCPSLEKEVRKALKKRADLEAIEVFGNNLRQLLLAPPLGQKSVLALDPGYRTGAKLVCLDRQGQLLDNTTIFPTHGKKQQEEAGKTVKKYIKTHNIEAIAVGNGTAGRETEKFIRSLDLDSSILVTLVNEDGASIYSASENARLEFPDHDITVRGAVSIGRRLQDPLAELVKIDPKSIGVGQYQHDVDQNLLKERLQQVVESCVNSVGVELNSASVELLTFVSGLNRTLAANIVAFRKTNGPFKKRSELLKVPRLGPKAFEQCAGFLRITGGVEPLDNSSVHPERYRLIRKMAKDTGSSVAGLITSTSARKKIVLEEYIDDSVGMETLLDIMDELAAPGRDPRENFRSFSFDRTILTIDDVREGMVIPAIITNITKFGAFADIGIKQDGLIHISQMADRFIKDPAEVVSIGQQVKVRVLQVDNARNRIGLSLRN
ncbi:RNA-binding transcriptional accessory protein [Desulfomarina profundi]|uniref:RNA-binding transcriptional accessory protein n=1 Tax=Desulfomarina profundi TaxID=2772557 RepID=A0A8D5FPB1_9BACT|nr:Tex family protein [Desulfomarina profundi]BCL61904.1 RNA-binding transcriptional accessory protein [Desulfomarina profundi]